MLNEKLPGILSVIEWAGWGAGVDRAMMEHHVLPLYMHDYMHC